MRRSAAAVAVLASLATTAAAEDPTALEPILVSAERRESADSDAALAVTALGADQVRRGDIASLKDLAGAAPNVELVDFSARAISNPQFRGVGGSTTNPGVTTYLDGVPQLSADTSSQELVDVGQVEFVRGAQGTLYGRNTLGGVINLWSRAPAPQWSAGAVAGFGDAAQRLYKLGVSGPAFDQRLAFSLAAGQRGRDGYSENLETGSRLDSRSARFGKAQLLAALDGLQLRAIASVESARDGDFALYDLDALRRAPHRVRHDYTGFTRRVVQSQTLLADYTGESFQLRSISGRVAYGAREVTDLDASAQPNLTRDNRRRGEQLTQELQWLSREDAPWRLGEALRIGGIGGLFGFRQDNDQATTNFIAQSGLLDQLGGFLPLPAAGSLPPLGSPLNQLPLPLPQLLRAEDRGIAALHDTGYGAYLQVEAALSSHWRAALGARYDVERKRGDLASSTVIIAPAGEIPQSGPDRVVQERTYRAFTPSLRLAWSGEHVLAYASGARGYRAGGFNALAPAGQESYAEERSRNLELGLKAAFPGWRASLALFDIELQALQLNVPVPNGAGRFYIANAGGARNRGAELELRARPVAGVEAYASAGALSARFAGGSRNLDRDISGKRLPFAAPLTATLGLVLGNERWQVQPEVQRSGDYWYTPDNDERLVPVTLVNLRGALRVGDVELEAWGRNLADRAYVPLAIPYPGLAPSGFVGETAAPRTFGLTLHYDL